MLELRRIEEVEVKSQRMKRERDEGSSQWDGDLYEYGIHTSRQRICLIAFSQYQKILKEKARARTVSYRWYLALLSLMLLISPHTLADSHCSKVYWPLSKLKCSSLP